MEKIKKFEERVKKEVEKIVESHKKFHKFYRPTEAKKVIIDEENKKAAFVLFEQIDTDRCTENGSGWSGDQYRYSIWYINGTSEPKQIYEDHAWLRKGESSIDRKGRDSSINLVSLLDDGVIAEISPEEGKGISYTKKKVKINLEGIVGNVDDFMDQAKNLIETIAPRLGCDYLSDSMQLGDKSIAAIRYTTENGSTYGYDTIYLVWKTNSGDIRYQELIDSKYSKDYIFIRSIDEKDGKTISVETSEGTFDRKISED